MLQNNTSCLRKYYNGYNGKINTVASVLSAVFSGGVLLWLIYQHLERPKIKNLRIGIEPVELTLPGEVPHVLVTGVNFGKDELKLVRIAISTSFWKFRRSKRFNVPRNDTFPLAVAPGDYFNARFLTSRQASFLGLKDLKHFGVEDVYGKVHWAEIKSLKQAQKLWLKDYGEDNR